MQEKLMSPKQLRKIFPSSKGNEREIYSHLERALREGDWKKIPGIIVLDMPAPFKEMTSRYDYLLYDGNHRLRFSIGNSQTLPVLIVESEDDFGRLEEFADISRTPNYGSNPSYNLPYTVNNVFDYEFSWAEAVEFFSRWFYERKDDKDFVVT